LDIRTPGGWLYGSDYTARGTVRLHVAEPSPIFRTLVCNPKGEPLHGPDVSIAAHPGGRLVAAGTSHGVSLFDLTTGLKVGHLDSGFTPHVRFDLSGGDLFTWGEQGLLHWPVRPGAGGQEGLFSHPGNSKPKVWDTRTGELAADMKDIGGLFFSSDGRWLTYGWRRWEVGTWREGPSLANRVWAVLAWSRDGQYYFVSGPDRTLQLVDSVTGKTLIVKGRLALVPPL
jgi:WD40 repeat protein